MSKFDKNAKTAEHAPTPEEQLLVTQVGHGAVATVAVSQALSVDDLAADAGSGLQNVTATDLATPLLVILQGNSPQVKRSDGKYISGAKEGDIFNTMTNAVVDGTVGLTVIPAYFAKNYLEWKPKRGGFVAMHNADTPLKGQVVMVEVTDQEGHKKLVPTLPNGNTLVETNHHYALVLNADGSFDPVVIPMASSQLKSSRLWNSLMSKVKLSKSDGSLFTPASYYNTYHLTTKARARDTFSWCVWSVEPAGPTPSRALYEAGKAFERAVSSGAVKIKVEEPAPEAHAAVAEAAGAEDDGVPF